MSPIGSRPPEVAVSTWVRRTPLDVWHAVADPRRYASWSPEASGVTASAEAAGPMAVGTTFSGSNRNGPFRWSTRCVVVESTPGETFAFDVSYLGMSVARWRYVLTELDGSTHVEEQWWDTRGPVMTAIGVVGTGVRDRRTHNERTMRETLEALAADLERTQD